jgi:hypothetical protein
MRTARRQSCRPRIEQRHLGARLPVYCVKRDGVVVLATIPIKEHLDVQRHVPGDADVGHPQPFGAADVAGAAVGEDLIADVQVIVATTRASACPRWCKYKYSRCNVLS